MRAFPIKGLIITKPVNIHNYEVDHTYLIYDSEQLVSIVLSHVNTIGNWITQDNIEIITGETTLYKLQLLTTFDSYDIAYKHWPAIIKHKLIGSTTVFEIIPKKFKEGKNVQTCSECHCTFLAAKSQPYCKNCCNKFALAYLIDNSKKIDNAKVYNRKFVEKIADHSYDMGAANLSVESHTKWLKEELDGYNTD
jgi:hypothetical protein